MLFLIVGIIYERRHTREISEYGGLAHVMPKLRHRLRHRHAQLRRPAAAERLHRRVHHPAGRLRGQPRLGGLRGDRRDPRRGVPAVALPAHHARPGDQRQEPEPARPELREMAVFAAADRLGHLDRHLSQALLRHPGQAGGADRRARDGPTTSAGRDRRAAIGGRPAAPSPIRSDAAGGANGA